MSIQDRVSFTHSALTIEDFCGLNKRIHWFLQYPGILKSGDIFGHIKRK